MLSTLTFRGPITDADVANARELVSAAAAYLAELEHLHAQQQRPYAARNASAKPGDGQETA